MEKLPNGLVTIVNLPGTGSLLSRSWTAYREHFAPLMYFSLLMALGALINTSLISFVNYLFRNAGDGSLVFAHVIVAVLNLVAGFYFSFIFAGMILFCKKIIDGKSTTVMKSLEEGREHAKSVFWAGLLLAFLFYGSLFTGFLFVIFFVWYYFALYIVIIEKERGMMAFAKSRYLTHGMFLKTFGRYLSLTAILFALYFVAYLFLGIPGLGAWLFMPLAVAITILSFPFFTLYEYLRYEDIAIVQRNVPFAFYRGEKVAITAWALFGFLFFSLAWSYGVMSQNAQTKFLAAVAQIAGEFVLPYAEEVQKNLDSASEKFDMLYFELPQKKQNETLPFSPTRE